MISSDMIRTTLEMLILSVLAEGASYGYAISQRLREQSAGAYDPKETTLYAAIRRLEQKGYLTSFPGSETAGRPRTYYALTAAGETQLQDLKQTWRDGIIAVTRILGEG